MKTSDLFQKALKFVLQWEGGYVNHPNDSGGATNKGITQRTYNSWLENQGLPHPKSVQQITDEEVAKIYKMAYWDVVYHYENPEPLSIALFDFAVLAGPRRAQLILSRIGRDANQFLIQRETYFKAIAKGKNKVFLKGWLNRNNALRKYLNL